MTRALAWFQHLSNLLVGGTGLVYFVMKHLLTSEDEFSVVNHPLQPDFQHLHVLAAPLLVFALGILWGRHAAPNVGRVGARGHRSGLLLLAGFWPMVVSGYLLQVAVEPEWRQAWMVAHLVTSATWLLGSLGHLARTTLAWRRHRQDAQVVLGTPGLPRE